MTDLFVKPNDTHQFLDPSSSHPYHCKKGMSCSNKALRLKRIGKMETLKRIEKMVNGKKIQ